MDFALKGLAGRLALAGLVSLSLSGCVKSMALNGAINAMTSGSGFGTEDDPELVKDAVPFGLMTMESLFAEAPEHEGLTLALVSGYTQYAYAFVHQEAFFLKFDDYDAYQAKIKRANKLYRRALRYGRAGLETAYPGFMAELDSAPEEALKRLKVEDVPLLYWTAASWGGAISSGSDNLAMLVDLPKVRLLVARALELDPDYDVGALHELSISLDMAPSGAGAESAKAHFQAALALSQGAKAGPWISYAESVLVPQQDLEGFNAAMDEALSIDVDEFPANRLVNIIAQERATFLLDHTDYLFGG